MIKTVNLPPDLVYNGEEANIIKKKRKNIRESKTKRTISRYDSLFIGASVQYD